MQPKRILTESLKASSATITNTQLQEDRAAKRELERVVNELHEWLLQEGYNRIDADAIVRRILTRADADV